MNYETMQFEGDLLIYLPGKYWTVYKMIENNKKKLIADFLFRKNCPKLVWAPTPYTAPNFVWEHPCILLHIIPSLFTDIA